MLRAELPLSQRNAVRKLFGLPAERGSSDLLRVESEEKEGGAVERGAVEAGAGVRLRPLSAVRPRRPEGVPPLAIPK
jgi:hypothetical protein